MQIKLINMPFSSVSIPSIALSQLESTIKTEFGDQIEIDIHYLNHDFVNYFGYDNYQQLSISGPGQAAGLGEWYFRQVAFPESEDNSEEYFSRYGETFGAEFMEAYTGTLQKKRDTLTAFLDQLIDDYELGEVDLVGFTTMFFQTIPSIAMARRIKERNPDVMVIMGGANCEAPMGQALVKNITCLDFVFGGQGLISFKKFVANLLNEDEAENHNIHGVFSRENLDRVVVKAGPHMPMGEKALRRMGDELPIQGEPVALNYDSFLESFEEHLYYFNEKPRLLFETSRGCWWGARSHCTFCGLNGATMSFRAMKSETAVEYITNLFERYGDRVSNFSSVDNIVPTEYITDVFPKLDVPEHVGLFYEVRANLTDEELEAFSNAHVYVIQPGIESLYTNTLKIMKKGTTSFNNIGFMKRCLKHSVFPTWNLLVGFPGEDPASYEKYVNDLHRLAHLPPPDNTFMVRFDRYSPYFMQAEEYQLDLEPFPYYGLSFPFEGKDLFDVAYFFENRNYNLPYLSNISGWLHAIQQEVFKWKLPWVDSIETQQIPRELYFDSEDVHTIIDSRDGERKTYEISHAARKLLDICEERAISPMRMFKLLQEEGFKLPILEQAFAEIQEKELIWEEGKTVLNLVMANKPVWFFGSTVDHLTA